VITLTSNYITRLSMYISWKVKKLSILFLALKHGSWSRSPGLWPSPWDPSRRSGAPASRPSSRPRTSMWRPSQPYRTSISPVKSMTEKWPFPSTRRTLRMTEKIIIRPHSPDQISFPPEFLSQFLSFRPSFWPLSTAGSTWRLTKIWSGSGKGSLFINHTER